MPPETPTLTRQAGRTKVAHLRAALAAALSVPVQDMHAVGALNGADTYLRVWWTAAGRVEVRLHGRGVTWEQVRAALTTHDLRCPDEGSPTTWAW